LSPQVGTHCEQIRLSEPFSRLLDAKVLYIHIFNDAFTPSVPFPTQHGVILMVGTRRPKAIGGIFLSAYSPELVSIMRAALEELMTMVPLEQAADSTKPYLADLF
jgi:hypothetical protein